MSTRAFPTYPDDADLFADADLAATAARYHGYGVKEVVVKDGEHPCLVVTEAEKHSVPAEIVESLVDTTGAGDSFNAGYLAARVSGCAPGEACKRAPPSFCAGCFRIRRTPATGCHRRFSHVFIGVAATPAQDPRVARVSVFP